MKVITIKQPFASLIAAGIKEYEFRTWKTKYRGEIFIHAGKGIDKKAMKKFEGYGLDYPRGCIIAKAVLADCIEVNEGFRSVLNKKNPVVYSSIIKHTEWEGYAFRLDRIEKVEPIPVKGKLSIWEYEGEIHMLNRKLHFDKIQNARDLGGLKTKEGKTIICGLLLRAANLHETTMADKQKLSEEHRLAKVVDLRTDMEKQQKPDAVPEGIEYISNPIFDERVFGISHEKGATDEQGEVQIPALEDLYRMMVSEEQCRRNFGAALRFVMEHDFATGSVLWHCTEGKDRCGLLAVFLLSALGVEREVIVEDYLLTNETNVPKAEAAYQQLLAAGKPERMAESLKNIFLAKESYLNAAFEVIEKQFGGMDNYLREGLGISDETILRFREKVLQ